MTRKLMLPLLVAAATFVVVPAANAASVGSLAGKVAGLTKTISHIQDTDKGQTAAINRVDNRVDTVVKNLSPVLVALPDVATALGALADPVTGLRALNLARPAIAGVDCSTGNCVAKGTDSVLIAYHPAAGAFILRFKKNIANRINLVTAIPTGGAPAVGSAVNCDSAPNNCQALGASTPAGAGTDVLVTLQNSTTGAGTDGNGFNFAAISG